MNIDKFWLVCCGFWALLWGSMGVDGDGWGFVLLLVLSYFIISVWWVTDLCLLVSVRWWCCE